ncbi:MAG: hypothetical protein H7327_14410 [Herminiimonas sp.]|nr:hypothetical protein [Herminiimonas sp.]
MAGAIAALETHPERALRKLPGVRRMLRQPLSLKWLSAWGKLRGLPPEAPFWGRLASCRELQRPADLRLASRSRTGAHQILRSLIDAMGSSARVRLSDGFHGGITTKGLSVNLSHLLHLAGIPLGPRLLLELQRSRSAVLEIGRAVHAGEILIGTDQRQRCKAGAGVIVGVEAQVLGGHGRCGVTAEAAMGSDVRTPSGVLLRVAQRPSEDGDGPDDCRVKAGMQEIVDFLFEQSHNGEPSDSDALFNRFAAAFFDDPDISVSWAGQKSVVGERSASCSLGAYVQVPGTRLRFGPVIGVSAEESNLVQHNPGDEGGRMQTVSFRHGFERDVHFGAGLNGKIGGTTHAHSGLSVGDIALFNGGLPEWDFTLSRESQASKVRLVRENGVLQPLSCLCAIEFNHVDEYAAAVLASKSQWIAMLVLKYAASDDPKRCAEQALEEHLAQVRCNARLNQQFVQRFHLRPEIARLIDRNEQTADLIRANEHLDPAARTHACALLQTRTAELLARPDAWQPVELRVIERTGSSRRRGLLLALHLATETTVEGERKLVALNGQDDGSGSKSAPDAAGALATRRNDANMTMMQDRRAQNF